MLSLFVEQLGEKQPAGVDIVASRLLREIFPHRGSSGQPQYAVWHPRQNSHPGRKYIRLDLVALVEGTENNGILRQPAIGPPQAGIRYRLAGVRQEIAAGKIDQRLRPERTMLRRNDGVIGK